MARAGLPALREGTRTGKFQYWAESSNITPGGEGQAGNDLIGRELF